MNKEKPNKILYMVLSVLLAVAFWFYVDAEQGNLMSRSFSGIPVEFIGAEDTLPSRGLMVSDGGEATIDLRLSGPRTVIASLRRSELSVQVDLRDITAAGTYSRLYNLITADNVDGTSIQIESASRSSVRVQVEAMSTKTIPVAVQVTGDVAEGYIYMAEKLMQDPTVLTISGREEDIDPVESALVTVDLTGVESTVSQEFNYQLVDRDGNEVDNSEGRIRVSVKRVSVTAPVYVTKELALTVKFKEAPGSSLSYVDWGLEDPEIRSITVAGEPASLEGREEIVLAEVDLSTLLSDAAIPMEIPLPSGCVNLSGYSSVTLTVNFRRLETRNFTVTNISAIGVGSGLSQSRLTNSVDVLVRGPAGTFDDLTAEDIRIVADLSEYPRKGTYSVPAKVYVDGFDGVGAVGSYTVAYRITSS